MKPMATPTDGRSTIEYLLGRGRLERIDGKRTEISADDSAWAQSTAPTAVEAVG